MKIELDMELNHEDRLNYVNKILEETECNEYLLELFANYLLTAKDKENHRKLDYSFYLNIDKHIEYSDDRAFEDYMSPYQDIWEDLSEEKPNDRVIISETKKEQIRQIFDTLSPRERQCFLLYKVEGFTQQKIADNLNIARESVKTHAFRAMVKINNILSP